MSNIVFLDAAIVQHVPHEHHYGGSDERLAGWLSQILGHNVASRHARKQLDHARQKVTVSVWSLSYFSSPLRNQRRLHPESEIVEQLFSPPPRLLLDQHAASVFAAEELDSRILRALPQDKWLLASLLQKAIRRGDVAYATAAAYRLAQMDSAYVARRLPIIAYEDLGIANLPLIVVVRRFASAVITTQPKHGAAQAAHIAGALAKSLKSRTACDIASLCEFSPAAKALVRTISGKPLADLIARAGFTDCPLVERAVILRLLIGIRPDGIAPSSDRREARAVALHTILGNMLLPALVIEAVLVGTQTEGLNVAIALAYASMAASSTVTTTNLRRDNLDSRTLSGIPAYVVDMYTRPGQAAFRLLLARAPELRELLTRFVPRRDHVRCIGFLIFHLEGSLLDRRLREVVPEFRTRG